MNLQFIAGIFTVACIVGIVAIICSAANELKKKENITRNIYRDIQPHQVAMMKKIFPKFDWVRIDLNIAEAQKDLPVQYQPSHVDEGGIIECVPKRIDTRV